MTNQIHIAAQYLATAAISFLEKKEDDSHTNLGFNSEKGYLETWTLSSKGHQLAFDYLQFSLHWLENETILETLKLDGKTHKEVVAWISNATSVIDKNKSYKYHLHYELPYKEITNDLIFHEPNQEQLNYLVNLRTIAQGAIENVVTDMKLDTSIRVWPHHFDTGSFAILDAYNNINIGFGMAIPDSIINEFYFYTSGYKNNTAIDPKSFDPLPRGQWHNNDFKGAILPVSGIDKIAAYDFFIKSNTAYQNQ